MNPDFAGLGISVKYSDVEKAAAALDDFERKGRAAELQVGKLATRAKQMLGGVSIGLAANHLAKLADTWSDLSSRVGLAAGSMEAAPIIMERIGAMARQTYSDLEQTAEAFIANAATLRELGYTTQQTLDYTEALNNSLVISGAKGDVAATVMNALSKAMALGKLQGDNLNTVLASGGRVADALAASMGVSTLQLRKLGAEGKITRTELFGITKELENLRREADAMPATISDAFTQLRNATLLYVGGADQAAGASAKVAESILYLADNFNTVADAGLQLAQILIGALAGRALAGIVGTAATSTSSIVALVTAMRAGTITAAAFTASLGPIAVTVGAVAAGIMLLSNNQSAASKAAERFDKVIGLNADALDKAKDASGRYSQALREQIAMQLEAAKASEALANAEYLSANARAHGFRQMTGLKFAPFEYAANKAQAEADAITGAVLQIEKQLARIDENGVIKPSATDDTSTKNTKSSKTVDQMIDSDIQAIRDRTEALILEIELVGKSTYEQEKRRVSLDLEQAALAKLRDEAIKKGQTDLSNIKLSENQRKKIDEVSDAYARQAEELRRVQENQDIADQKTLEFYDTFKSSSIGAITQANSLSDALQNIIDKLADLALNSAFDALFKPSIGGSSGGIFGSAFSGIGNIFGGGSGFGTNYFPPAPSMGLFATGGLASDRGMTL